MYSVQLLSSDARHEINVEPGSPGETPVKAGESDRLQTSSLILQLTDKILFPQIYTRHSRLFPKKKKRKESINCLSVCVYVRTSLLDTDMKQLVFFVSVTLHVSQLPDTQR